MNRSLAAGAEDEAGDLARLTFQRKGGHTTGGAEARDDALFMTAREVVAQEGRRLLVWDGVEEADGEGRATAFGTRVRVTAAMRLRPWRWP